MIRRLAIVAAPAVLIVLAMLAVSLVGCTVVPPTDRPEPEPSAQAAPTP